VVVGVGIERLPVGLGEYPSLVMPELAGGNAAGVLLCPVISQEPDELVRQPDDTLTGARFGRAGVWPGLLPLGTVTGFPAAYAASVLALGP